MSDINHLTKEEHELLAELIKELKMNLIRDYNLGFERIVAPDKKGNYYLREDTLKTEDEELYNVYMRTLHHNY